MILGDCPYCGEHFAIGVPDNLPQMLKCTCEECGKWFWEYCSRINPRSYLPEEVEVNEETKSVKIKEKK